MKQVVGIISTLLLIPLLYVLQFGVMKEWTKAQETKNEIEKSIELTPKQHAAPIIMRDRNGHTFSENYTEWRQPLPLSAIPTFVQDLFLESEDRTFYDHRGYDVAAIARAFAVNAKSQERRQGGSTITQQVVRLLYLSNEKTYERKVKELLYAAQLEKQYSKEQILEMYLNEVYFGHQVYGIGAAATYYFSRPINQLNEAELAFLAAIPNNPSLYDPLRQFKTTKERQERLLDVLVKYGKLSAEKANAYKKVPIRLQIKKKKDRYPTYSTYVLYELRELIGQEEGWIKKIEEAKQNKQKQLFQQQWDKRMEEILATGLVIETALAPSKQKQDEAFANKLLSNYKNLQAGAAVIDHQRQEIVSLYGGKHYQKANFHRAYQAFRQPGSTFKPLIVYGPYFESGAYTHTSLIDSSNFCIGSYCPENIGGHRYGLTTIQSAFRYSHNTSAVRILNQIGIDDAFSYIDQFQFQKINPQDRTLAAALGGLSEGVSPLELARAYTSFHNGRYAPARAIRQVKNSQGKVLYTWPKETQIVWSPLTVETMQKLLQDVVVNGTGRGIRYTTSFTGVKTGTSDQYKDLWVAGLNDHYTAAVWLGYDQPISIQWISDRNVHLTLFSQFLQYHPQ